MKKKVVTLIIFLLILTVGYFGYKIFLLFNYQVELNEDVVERLKVSGNVIKITTNTTIDNSKMQQFEDISYRQFKDNFVLKKDETYNELIYPYYSYYLLDNSSDKYTALFKVGRTFSAYETLTSSDVTTFGFGFKGTNTKELLKKYNLNNDFDIYKYIIKHYSDKLNIFLVEMKLE